MSVHFPELTPNQAHAVGGQLALIDPWQRLKFDANALAAYLNRPDPALQRHAIMADGHLAGAIALRSPWLRGPYLELLAVFPAAQGRGLGKRALNWAVAQAGSAANFWACVSAFNHPARGFYARMGFVETTELTDLVTSGENEILLRKIL